MLTDATGAGGGVATDTDTAAETPSIVALTLALPAATAVTMPAFDTVATVGFELLQVTVLFVNVVPVELSAVAVRVAVPPAASCRAVGDATTLATATDVTVNVAVARA
jgi:hypothetical protein